MSERTDIEHPQLGHLAYDDDIDAYSAVVGVKGRSVRLCIHCSHFEGDPPAILVAVNIAAKLEQLSKAAAEQAVRDLLELKNETWLHEGEKPISEQNFLRKLVLEDIGIHNRGAAEFFHADGDLFGGHCVVVDMNPDYSFRTAYLAG